MTDDAIMKFILLVEVHFPRAKFSGDERREAVWMRSMREILSEYEPEVLAAASEMIVRTRDPHNDGSMFPKPSECIAACRKIMRQADIITAAELFRASADEAKQISGYRNVPLIEIRPGEVGWQQWLNHLRHERPDLAGEAESKGLIKASKRWPDAEAMLFDPSPKSADLLSRLPQLKQMPN